jgi:hypothetical protein
MYIGEWWRKNNLVLTNMKNLSNIVFLFLLLSACSSKAYLSKQGSLTGKKIALGVINITREKGSKTVYNDSVCACMGQTIAETIYPYLQKAGATIITIPTEQKTSESRINAIADSLQVDYLLSGTGTTERTGKTDYMRELNIKLVSVKSKEIVLTGSYSGFSVLPSGAADRIGKKILKQK